MIKNFEDFINENNDGTLSIEDFNKSGKILSVENKKGTYVLKNKTHKITFYCNGGSDIIVYGKDLEDANYIFDVKNTTILSYKDKSKDMVLNFSNGKEINLEDPTGNDGVGYNIEKL